MGVWDIEEKYLIALIYDTNRVGQALLDFSEEDYNKYFPSRLADIVLNMLGLGNSSDEPPETDSKSNVNGKGHGFKGGRYNNLFNDPEYLDEKLLREILAGIRHDPENVYKTKVPTKTDGASHIWEIEEDFIIELIQELNRLGQEMAGIEIEAWGTYFSINLPTIILEMLGIPDDYTEPITEEDFREDDNSYEKEHPAEFYGSFYYDMFNYPSFQGREKLKQYLDGIKDRQDEFKKINKAGRG